MNRLRADFKLALVVMFGVITVLGVTPFAVYRFLSGEPLVGAIDLLIVTCIALGAGYAWRTGRTEGATLFVAITYSVGCVAVAHLAGLSGLLWVYPVLVANFMLVRRGRAVVISAIAIVAVVLGDAALATAAQKTMFIVTGLVVSLFSYVFASRSEMQRLQLEAVASRDPLTGAQNRRGMETELEIAMAASMRDGAPLGLLIFDLDRFKQINDSFGHEAGDVVLMQISDLVRRSTRKGDRFYRLGGEEFGLLIPGADAASLHLIAEKLRVSVEHHIRCRDRCITISIGAAAFVAGESAGQWQARADAAMYRAKRNGRNRTVVDVSGEGDADSPVTESRVVGTSDAA